jgi:hypothetical protein
MTSLIDAITAGQSYRAREQAIRGNELQMAATRRAEEQRPLESRLAQIALGQRQGIAPGTPGMKAEPQDRQSALGELVALNPELGAQVQAAGLKLDADEQTRAENQSKALASFLVALDSLPEDQRAGARDMFLQTPVAQAVVGNQIMEALRAQTDFSDAVIKPRLAQARAALGVAPDSLESQYTNIGESMRNGQRVYTGLNKRTGRFEVIPTEDGISPIPTAERGSRTAVNVDFGGLTMRPDGTVGLPLAGGVESKTQEALLNNEGVLASLQQIEQQFKPEYQQVGTRIGNRWAELKDMFGAGQITPADRQQLEGFAAYRAETAANLSAIINALAGAAVSDGEAKRILAFIPDAGTGIFDGDSPAVFESKLRSAIGRVRLAIARQQYALANGIDLDPKVLQGRIPLEGMQTIMRNRAAALGREGSTRGLKGADLNNFVRQQFQREFGIGAAQ